MFRLRGQINWALDFASPGICGGDEDDRWEILNGNNQPTIFYGNSISTTPAEEGCSEEI